MKKVTSTIIILALLIGIISIPSMVSYASTARGIGIKDNTVYYIMNNQNQKLLSPTSFSSDI